MARLFLGRILESSISLMENAFLVFDAKGLKEFLNSSNLVESFRNNERLKFWNEVATQCPYDTFFDFAITSYNINEQPNTLFPHDAWINSLLSNRKLTKKRKDIHALISKLTGLKAKVKSQNTRSSHVVGLQIYSTEKTSFFHRDSHCIGSINISDILNNTYSFTKAQVLIQNHLSKYCNRDYGSRFELRMGFRGLLMMLTQEEEFFNQQLGRALFFSIPSVTFCGYKLLMGHSFLEIIQNIKARHQIINHGAMRAIGLLTLYLKGLFSRLDDSCWSKELREILKIDDVLHRENIAGNFI